MVAARRVTQENQGKKTAGVAGVKAGGPLIRLLVVERLRHGEGIRAQPMHRVLIPTTGTPGEGRPLGLPVLLDRAHQTLVTVALEPQGDARFASNSDGFRACLAPLARRTRALAHRDVVLTAGMVLVGAAYTFVWLHESLRLPTSGPGGHRRRSAPPPWPPG